MNSSSKHDNFVMPLAATVNYVQHERKAEPATEHVGARNERLRSAYPVMCCRRVSEGSGSATSHLMVSERLPSCNCATQV
jgi:hypothetical protein